MRIRWKVTLTRRLPYGAENRRRDRHGRVQLIPTSTRLNRGRLRVEKQSLVDWALEELSPSDRLFSTISMRAHTHIRPSAVEVTSQQRQLPDSVSIILEIPVPSHSSAAKPSTNKPQYTQHHDTPQAQPHQQDSSMQWIFPGFSAEAGVRNTPCICYIQKKRDIYSRTTVFRNNYSHTTPIN